ncbi:MAG: methylated-DNA--[protein]-cysteine S-methyltransferase [Armatimonadetes bacterium]|nr:methylated-DNA--[protein]-cysteine S-methyltransferase [Armatimonadota bacterium]NIO76153.1 methylated-DNA--[protein]-cysteine S-methyltransferase [Armatimonadota bacterium]NIO98849.1 methylated-DNA--[protein]-cysteine S-methyltransferase [Armatimonadota bacterium]
MTIFTPLGPVAVEFRGNTILRLSLRAPGSTISQKKENPEETRLRADLARYFAGEKVSFSRYPVDLSSLPEFSRQVLLATRRISYGERWSYGELARRIGRPRAARAVGQALKRNPIAIVIPCHRVIGVNGDLRGFAGGLDLKKRLLALEAGCKPRK